MSNVLRELIVKISLSGADKAKKEEDDLSKSTDKTTREFKDQDKAVSNLSRQLTGFGQSLSNISSVLTAFALGKAISLGFQAIHSAFSTVENTIGRAIEDASSAETALVSLGTALTITGEYSEDAMKEMKDFASQMQETSVASAGLVISLLSQAKAFGVSNSLSKQIVQGAIDFASATGKSIPEAFGAFTASLSGQTREVQKYVPAIKELTDEQLKAGKAVELLNDRFSGSAAKNLNTYAGSAAQLANAWGDVFENIGGPIIKALIPIFKDLSQTLKSLLPQFTSLGETIAQSFLIVRDALFGAFDLGSGADSVIGKLQEFILNAALLIEDFFFFLQGKPSYLGKITGAGNLAELIGVGLGTALGKLPGVLLEVVKAGFIPMLKGFKEFFAAFIGGFLSAAVEAVLADLPASIVNTLIKTFKFSAPFLDKFIGAFGGLSSVGAEDAANELPTEYQVKAKFQKMIRTPEGYEKWASEGSFMQSAKNVAQANSGISPGDQTLNKSDNRQYTNNLDVKINTNVPGQSIQRQLDSLFYSQQTAGGN